MCPTGGMMRLVTEDEAKMLQLEHVRSLNREIERLEQLARTRQITLDWYRDNHDRWRNEREAALKREARAWRYFWFEFVALLIFVLSLVVVWLVR